MNHGKHSDENSDKTKWPKCPKICSSYRGEKAEKFFNYRNTPDRNPDKIKSLYLSKFDFCYGGGREQAFWIMEMLLINFMTKLNDNFLNLDSSYIKQFFFSIVDDLGRKTAIKLDDWIQTSAYFQGIFGTSSFKGVSINCLAHHQVNLV